MFTKMPARIDVRNKHSSRPAGPPRERNAFMFAEALPSTAIPFIPLQGSEPGVKPGLLGAGGTRKSLHFLPRHTPPTRLLLKSDRAVSSSPGPQG